MVPDPMVMPLARELLECLEQEISKVKTPPLYVQLRTGTVVDHLLSINEDECRCGLAWVRPMAFFPSSTVILAQDETPTPKGITGWGVQLEIGAIRCAPVGDERSIPTADDWDAVTQAVMDDAAAMRRALCCFIERAPRRAKNLIVQQWQPLSIEGGCTGGAMSFTIWSPACDCTDAGPAS